MKLFLKENNSKINARLYSNLGTLFFLTCKKMNYLWYPNFLLQNVPITNMVSFFATLLECGCSKQPLQNFLF